MSCFGISIFKLPLNCSFYLNVFYKTSWVPKIVCALKISSLVGIWGVGFFGGGYSEMLISQQLCAEGVRAAACKAERCSLLACARHSTDIFPPPGPGDSGADPPFPCDAPHRRPCRWALPLRRRGTDQSPPPASHRQPRSIGPGARRSISSVFKDGGASLAFSSGFLNEQGQRTQPLSSPMS